MEIEEVQTERKPNRVAVRRIHTDRYLLTSLVAFGVTVVGVRVFLQLTGFPQIDNNVLHIAHALWGVLLLFIAVLLPLIYANRWAIQTSSLLSGLGIGLFIDEIGKFITQRNDYFFPPALPLIYGFFLLTVFIYLYFRRPREGDGRQALYHALESLQDILDGDLDDVEAGRLKSKLAIASRSEQRDISALATALMTHLDREKVTLVDRKPGVWQRAGQRVMIIGRHLGQRQHRRLVSIVLILWSVAAVISFAAVTAVVTGVIDLGDETTRALFNSSELSLIDSALWLWIILLLQMAIGLLSL